ncbi:MAG: tetratricopeptide repeat protein [Chloroflexi bacterium]|nr:tetratricopeptide repeat protein [Chloroflexota bacterium]
MNKRQFISLQTYLQQGLARLDAGQPDNAMRHAQHVLRYYPWHLAAYRLLGQACLADGDDNGAAQCLERVLSADPEDLAAHAGLALLKEAAGDHETSLWHIERACDIAPYSRELRAERTRFHARINGLPLPRLGISRSGMARLHLLNGQWWRTVAECQSLLESKPERIDLQMLLAEALWRGGNWERAGQICEAILELLPNALKANLLLATVLARAGQRNQSMDCLSIARSLDPENLVAQAWLGPLAPVAPETVHIPVPGPRGSEPLVEELPEETPNPLPMTDDLAEDSARWRRSMEQFLRRQSMAKDDG